MTRARARARNRRFFYIYEGISLPLLSLFLLHARGRRERAREDSRILVVFSRDAISREDLTQLTLPFGPRLSLLM